MTPDGAGADHRALRELVEALPLAAVLVEDGRITTFNAAAEVLYQHLAADAVDADFVELLFDPDDRHRIAGVLDDVGEGSLSGTWRVRRADGALLVSSFRLQRLGGGATCWIATDTMDQGLAEQERAVLLSAEHAARAEAEAARHRLAILSAASSAMTTTLDLDELLERVAHALVPAVADLCVIEFVDPDGEIGTLHVGHRDELLAKELTEVIRRRPIDRASDNPIATVLRTGVALRWEGSEATDRAVSEMARDAEQADAYAALGLRSSIVAPVRSGGATRGVLAASTVDRPLHGDDLALVTEVGHRLALAVGNVEAYVEERRRAEMLQLALLPTIAEVDGLTVAVRYLAATDGSKVGGDWYDVIPLGEGEVDVVIGDVVGHDMQAAVAMGQIRNALRAFACNPEARPAATLDDLDRMVTRLDLALATAVVASIRLDDEAITWSNAGHPPPLLLVDGQVSVLDEHLGAMLGISSTRPRRDGRTAFPPGATLVLYTDGAVEDRHHPIDEGIARLVAAIEAAAPDGPEAICDAIVASTAHVGPGRRDDIAILVVQRAARP